jgi:ADP-heptose:LPS heptosyltransferase
MNILLVSLLRAGDLLMHIKAIEVLAHLSDTNIYLLTHRQNKGLEFLFPWITKIFYFDRELVQRSQKEDFLPLDAGFQHTIKLISEMNEISFNTIYNFTNTKISALLISLIHAQTKVGLNYSKLQYFINDPNRWIHYLNNTEHSKVHMIDIFKNSLLETSNVYSTNNSTANAYSTHTSINNNHSRNNNIKKLTINKSKINRAKINNSKTICIQALTSDQKKNWPLKYWNELIKQLAARFTDYKISILCANTEKAQLLEAFKDHADTIVACSYKDAHTMISNASILITGDTSIKHLASFTTTSILELSLGSARHNETGIYAEHGYMLYNPITCQPCKHASACTHAFICHTTITVQDVFDSVVYILQENAIAPKTLYMTTIQPNSMLTYEPASGIKSGENREGTDYAERV